MAEEKEDAAPVESNNGQEKNQQFIINANQVNALLAYLAERPFKEVFQGIQMLQNLPKVETAK